MKIQKYTVSEKKNSINKINRADLLWHCDIFGSFLDYLFTLCKSTPMFVVYFITRY